MSYARKVRRKRDRAMEREAVAAACALRGCTCRPDIDHRQTSVSVYHDEECPAADTPSMLILGRGHNQTPGEWAEDIVTVLKALRQ